MMTNLALGRRIEEPHSNPSEATDGNSTQYDGHNGFSCFRWPDNLTVDLGSIHPLVCVRFLLWDGMGRPGAKRDGRRYRYRLLASEDHREWVLLHDTKSDSYNGWQVFRMKEPLAARYVRINGIWNSVNEWFHVVQLEAHDESPQTLSAAVTLEKVVTVQDLPFERENRPPISLRFQGFIDRLETTIRKNPALKVDAFTDELQEIRSMVPDLADIENVAGEIRRQIVGPVQEDLQRSKRVNITLSVVAIVIGLLGGILGTLSYFESQDMWRETAALVRKMSALLERAVR